MPQLHLKPNIFGVKLKFPFVPTLWGLLLLSKVSPAQTKGSNISNAIVASTVSSNGGTFSDTRSNADPALGNDIGQPSNDIYYRFMLSSQATVTLSHCCSTLDTYMHMLNSSGIVIASDDDNYSSPCPGVQSHIETTLQAGTYYVVSEGYGSSSGNIITTYG